VSTALGIKGFSGKAFLMISTFMECHPRQGFLSSLLALHPRPPTLNNSFKEKSFKKKFQKVFNSKLVPGSNQKENLKENKVFREN
jgi:hypothetical protein